MRVSLSLFNSCYYVQQCLLQFIYKSLGFVSLAELGFLSLRKHRYSQSTASFSSKVLLKA